MRIICSTIIEDDRKRKNLCDCIEIIGAEYDVKGNTVYADYIGDKATAQKLSSLFEQFKVHGISILG